jgi:hypothetical protein
MNLFTAVFTGFAVWSNPAPATAPDHATAPQAVAGVPNYDVTALTEADVDLYLDVMRAAANHVAHTNGGLTDYDDVVADRREVRARYDAIRAVVERQLGTSSANGAVTATPAELNGNEAAVRAADKDLLAPHAGEIQSLQNEVHGVINGK